MATAAVISSPPLRIAARSSSTVKKQKSEKKRSALDEVLQVVRCDRWFASERLRLAAEPLRPIQEHISGILSDFFWLRFLENNGAQQTPRHRSSWPSVSYPPGLSGLDILMADLEALKTYADFIHHLFHVWTMPLPEFYDPEKVKDYFSCRPHVLVFRILEVLSSFSYAAVRFQLTRTFKLSTKDVGANISSGDAAYHVGQLLKETMLNLGPTFIKVGQSLSTRPDIIGSEISKALSELHDKIPPFPRAVAMKIMEIELGGPVQNYFSYISEETVAAASFGQVYQGRTLDGYTVAIKVQRPNLLHSVVRDIYILRLGLDILKKVAKRKNDLYHYADELGKGLVGELDYRIESANASEFLDAHSQYPFMLVPKVLGHLTRKRVLTMEWMVGESPSSLLLRSGASGEVVDEFTRVEQLEAKRCLLDLVSKGLEATLVQLLETGLLHADPHPGNLRYTTEGCIGFLDFGLLCRMKQEHQIAMLASIIHIVYGDWGALVCDLASMDVVIPGTNLRHVTADLVENLGEVNYRDGIPDIKFSLVLGKIWSIALKYHFRMPPYFTLVLRSLASLEGLAVAADKNFKTFQAAYPYVVKKLLYENSASTRRILYSVVFNKRREIQWKKILLFLKVGSLRVASMGINTCAGNMPESQKSEHDISELVNLILRLLPSKDGAVLRRLVVTACLEGLITSPRFCTGTPSVPDSRNVEMLDQNMLFLRDLMARLDPSSVDSLDTFVADANTSLEFLAHFGLEEADLRYWEELCREAEFAVHRLRPLVTVRTGASLPDLRERVRAHREAVQRARDEFQQGTEDMRRYLQRSTTTSLQIEGISAKVKALWKEMKNLMSCKTDLQVEYDRQARVVARERARHQIRQQARASAEASLTRSTAELQAVEAEYQTFTEAVAQLRDLQTRLP